MRDALARNNYLSALGRTKGSMVSVNLVANTDLKTPEEFRQLVVKEENGVVVRLGEIADVVLGAENYDEDVRFNGQTATFMGIWVLPTANSLDVIERVREAMPEIQAQLPAGMKAGIPYDSTVYIQDAIDEVLKTLTETLLIVVVVIFLFLGSLRSVLIPVVAIPISLIGAVFLMLAAGFTINLLTLLAIVLSVGLVVDDAIVMVENVERHLHAGQAAASQAALDAARELVGPIIAMTITLAAVYTPVAHPGRPDGRAVPRVRLHAGGRGDRVRRRGAHPLADDGLEAAARGRHRARLRRVDQPALRGACARPTRGRSTGTLRYRPVVLTLWAIVVAAGGALLHVLAEGAGAGRGPGRRLRHRAGRPPTRRSTRPSCSRPQVHDVYRSFPETDSIFQITFPTGGFGGMVTKPWSERKKTTEQLLLESAGQARRRSPACA